MQTQLKQTTLEDLQVVSDKTPDELGCCLLCLRPLDPNANNLRCVKTVKSKPPAPRATDTLHCTDLTHFCTGQTVHRYPGSERADHEQHFGEFAKTILEQGQARVHLLHV